MIQGMKYRLDRAVEQILVRAYQRGGGLTGRDYSVLCESEITEELAGDTVHILGQPRAHAYALSEAGALLAQTILDRDAAQGG